MLKIETIWWMEGDFPVVQPTVGGIEVNLTRDEAWELQASINACLNGIAHHLARYMVLDGWGKKYHLCRKEDDSDVVTALCGTKPRAFFGSDETWKWTRWVLTHAPTGDGYCARCRAAYDRLEAAGRAEDAAT